MNSKREKFLQVVIMLATLLLGTFGSNFLSENHVYPLTVVLGPFAAGFLFVMLTQRTSRCDTCSLALSVVGTIGLGVIGMIISNTLDDSQPHAWLVWCMEKLWAPVGYSVYALLAFVLFIIVPLGCFILGRILGERVAPPQAQVA